MEEPKVPALVIVLRISSVTGIGFAASLGIFFLLGGFWFPGLLCFIVLAAFFIMMFYTERIAAADHRG